MSEIPAKAIWTHTPKKHPSLKSLLLKGLWCWDRSWRWKNLVSSTEGISWGMDFWRRWPAFAENPTRWHRSLASQRCGLQCSRSERKTLRWPHMVKAGSARGVNPPNRILYTIHSGETNRWTFTTATSHEQYVNYHETLRLLWTIRKTSKSNKKIQPDESTWVSFWFEV